MARRSPQLSAGGRQIAFYCARWKRPCIVTLQGEQPDCSSVRALRDHRFIVGPQRARRMDQLLPLPETARFMISDVLILFASLPLVRDGYETSGWLDCPSLRASNEHIPIVRVLRARRMVQLPATSPFAHPSTSLPLSLSAAPRLWPAPAPSPHRGAAAETLRQRPSCAPHQS